jgi:anti-anti-sigma factor
VHGDWLVAQLTGDVDQSNVTEIDAAIRNEGTSRPLLVDLSETRYLDSAGVAMLESFRHRTHVAFVLPTRSLIRRVLQITGIDQLVPTFATIDECPSQSPV